MFHATIILPVRDRKAMALATLESLENEIRVHVGNEKIEVIVVDDGSSDSVGDAIRTRFPAVLVRTITSAHGPSRARNLGAADANGDVLLFLDADGEVAPGWLHAMLAARTAGDVLLGNVVDFDGGRPQSVPRRATFIGKSLPCSAERANTGPSCNLAISRAAFTALGGFDEELPYYFEDSDLCIRARRAGYSFQFVPDAIFRHHGTEKKSGDAILMQEHNSTYAMLKFYDGHRTRLIAFSLLNAYWMAMRLVVWIMCGRLTDASRLLRGWASAHSRFVKRGG